MMPASMSRPQQRVRRPRRSTRPRQKAKATNSTRPDRAILTYTLPPRVPTFQLRP